jgi:hypothetical protein
MANKRALAKRAEQRSTRTHQAWATRHPELARQERSFRLQQAQLDTERDYCRPGTPETLAKASISDGSLARLFLRGTINSDELAWAAEIRIVHDRIAGEVRIATASLETRVDQSRTGDGTFFEKLGAVRAEVAYTRWRAWLGCLNAGRGVVRGGAAAPVLAMIAGDEGVNQVAARFSCDKRTATRLLIEALDAWPGFQRDACDDVDEATLLAAQAAIL